jgi:hypothetical protein
VSVPKKRSSQALSRSSLAYDDLAIKEEGHAASQYYRMVIVETEWVEQATIEEALLQYCARDTLAMVELRRALKEKIADERHRETDPGRWIRALSVSRKDRAGDIDKCGLVERAEN